MFAFVRIISDIAFIFLSYIFAYLLRFNILTLEGFYNFPFHEYSVYLGYIVFVYIVCFMFLNLYKTRKGFLVEVDEFIGLVWGITLAWSILIVFTFIKGEYQFSRSLVLFGWPISFLFIFVSRGIILQIELFFRAKGYGSKRAVIIGTDELAKAVAQRIKDRPSYGINLVGFIGYNGKDVLGKIDDLDRIVDIHNIKILFVAQKNYERSKLTKLADFCDQKQIDLRSIPDIFEILTTSPTVEDIEGMPLISLKHTRFTPLNRFIKRTFDILFSLFGIIVFSIPMVLISILIRITSPGGPAIYKQDRVGRGGKTFNLYKFRTMIPQAERYTGPVLALKDDPRKTLFGRFLRTTNLDELPQLFNILKGDMSFVGPRPERPVFVQEFKQLIPKYMERHKIRPGLAGWAQLHGGYHMPAEEKIKYDIYYIENWSFLLDVKIVLKYIQIAFTFQRRN
jgi:exopolysaccharide biosynthesis polyprenyl glycosylphosphotransferase